MAVLEWKYRGENHIFSWPDDSPILPTGSIVYFRSFVLEVVGIVSFLHGEPENRADLHIMCKCVEGKNDLASLANGGIREREKESTWID